MKTVLAALFAMLALGACKDTDSVQADVSKGNPEGQQLRKKYEEANKEADARRKAAEQ